ncbi:MAG: TetR/AcrR family transcriptional regulator C-terminal domain-containing protein [Actinoplanes sp.]
MTDFTGRILPLLWRRSIPARKATGRPPRLSVDAVVATGIRVADADGLEAASMARVATELSVATMTLYTYVPSRPELVDLMVDEVLGSRGLTTDPALAWRDRVGRYAERTFTMYREHPWLASVSQLRPPIGPGMLADREYVLAAVSGLGLPLHQVNAAALTISAWVTGAARQEAEEVLLRRATGLSSDDWWRERGELWENWFRVEDHPAMTALWNAGGFDRAAGEQAQDSYSYGLDLLLDGIERSVQ